MLDELQAMVEGRLQSDLPTRLLYCRDGSFERIVPCAVLKPANKSDVQKVLPFATSRQIPLAFRGGGTGKAGGCLTSGLVIDLGANLNRVKYDPVTKTVEVEAGATVASIERVLGPLGRTLGFPPEWHARSIGGIFASTSPDFTPGPWRDFFHALLSWTFMFSEGSTLFFSNSSGPGSTVGEFPEFWGERIAMIESASADWLKNRLEWSALPGPRFNPSMKRPSVNAVGVLAGGLGQTGVLLEARLQTLEIDSHSFTGLIAFGDLPTALDFLTQMVQEHGIAATLFERRQVRSALHHFRDPWLEWADEAGEWVALIGAPSGVFADWHFLNSVPGHRKWDAVGESFHSRVRFVMQAGLMRGGEGQARASLGDFFVPLPELEKVLDKVREELVQSRLLASLVVHVERGQIAIHPMGPANDLKPELPPEKVAGEIGVRIARTVLEIGGSIGLEYGLGRAKKNWIPLLPPWWLHYQTDLKAILDPGGVLVPSEEEFKAVSVISESVGVQQEDTQNNRDVLGCTGCGECRGTEPALRLCPGFAAAGEEEATPRAKAMLVEAFAKGELKKEDYLSEKVQKVASWCVQCRMCEQGCPAGLKIPEWTQEIAAARFLAEGGAWSGWLLAQADRLGPWLSQVSPVVNRVLRFGPVRWGLEKLTGFSRKREIPTFSNRPFLDVARKKGWDKVPESPRMRAAIFVDYFANYHRPEIAESLVKILHHNRIEAHVPKNQGASGFAALVTGNRDTALEHAKANLRVFADLAREGFPILCPEPTAALFLRKDLPRLVPGEESRLVASQVVEATTFLWELNEQGLLQRDFLKLDISCDHHVPCHVKALEKPPAGPKLLTLIPGAKVRVLDVSCSGMAGLWGMEKSNVDSSFKIGAPMLGLWRGGEASIGSSECSSCRIQMQHGDSRAVLHPLEIIAAAYGLTPKDFPRKIQGGKKR